MQVYGNKSMNNWHMYNEDVYSEYTPVEKNDIKSTRMTNRDYFDKEIN